MTRWFRFLGLTTACFMLTGCVAAEKYNALKLERDRLAEQMAQAQTEAAAARSEADSYKNQLKAIMDSGGNLQALVGNLQKQNADLQAQLDDLNRRYAEAMNKAPGTVALPEETNRALMDLAAQYPDLIEYDAARGMLKFKSDVTFALGSAELTPRAKEVLAKFAQILNSPAIANYEFMVAGHTDNIPVSRPETIRAGHKDNWYLSAHRAISVGNALMADHVSPQRIAVVGYGDQRPIASNASDAGRAQNRRVEVLITPRTVTAARVAPAAGTRTRLNAAPRGAAMNKETPAPAPAPTPAPAPAPAAGPNK